MPFATIPQTPAVQPSNDLPDHLEHQPKFALPYETFDGYNIGHTDMRWMSIGLAQYNAAEASAKTFRHSGKRWTRQSEELPLYRALDLATFLLMAVFESGSGVVQVPKGTFEGQTCDLEITPEHLPHGADTAYSNHIQAQLPRLRDRARVLGRVIDRLRASNLI